MRSAPRLASPAPIFFALLLLCGATSTRADQPPLELSLYLWGESLHGEIDTDRGAVDMHVPFSDLLDHLNVGVMARARANFDRFSIVGDVEYVKLESDRKRRSIRLGPRGGIELDAEAKAELEQWTAELNAGYRVFETQSFMARSASDPRRFAGEIYLGGRYISIDPEVDVRVNQQSRNVGETMDWLDGLVGVRLFLDLSRTVAMSLQGDVGGFGIGNSSEISYSGIWALSWRLSDSLALHAGYKLLHFDRDVGDSEVRLQGRGPFLATTFAF